MYPGMAIVIVINLWLGGSVEAVRVACPRWRWEFSGDTISHITGQLFLIVFLIWSYVLVGRLSGWFSALKLSWLTLTVVVVSVLGCVDEA